MTSTGETVRLTVVVTKEGRHHVAYTPELGVASQGPTVDDALRSLKEAVELYLEDPDARAPDRALAPELHVIEVKEPDPSNHLRAHPR